MLIDVFFSLQAMGELLTVLVRGLRARTINDPPLDVEASVRLTEELIICHQVDHFQYYLVAILAEVFTTSPAVLRKSGLELTAEDIFECGSFEAITKEIARRRLDTLGRKSFRKIHNFIRGIAPDLTRHSEPETLVARAIAKRNLIVHNRGRVNQLYLDATGETLLVGSQVPLGLESIRDSLHGLGWVADTVDVALVDKYGLATVEIPFGEQN
jgi:hypothetical protein